MSIQAPSSHLRAVVCALFLGLGGALQADVPEATITSPASAITVAGGQVVAFTATSTDSVGYDTYTVTSYTWDFGDGTTGAGATTTHAYASDGVRTVTLTVAYRGATLLATYPRIKTVVVNKTATATRTVTVLAPPSIGSFSASSTSVGVGKPVTLSWTTTNATSLSVTGVGSVAGNTTVVYPTATTTYTLTAANAAGSTSAAVTVTTYTVGVSLSPGSATLRLGEAATFQAAVVPANQGVSWSAPGATLTSATGTSVLFTGGTTGTYLLRASSLEDPAQSATATVVVLPVSIGTPVATPSDARALQGGTVGFTALVSNAVNTAVSWSVNGGGTISSNGLFTASQLGIWTVTATSQADPSKSASTSVQVVPLVVTVSPATATVRSGQTQAFSAGVTGAGTPSQLVTWWVDGVAGGNGTLGTITSAGVYTAPSVPGNHTIQARSLLDGTQGTATVQMATWTLRWKKDIVYLGTKEVAEIDQDGVHVTLVDHLGSPRYEVRADQTIVEQKFAPFGESLTDPTTAGKFAKGFTNHEQTDPSGLIYMQARFYAPWYGRFLSPDPARDQHFEQTQSWNIYSYVQNNPVMVTDPTGMYSFKEFMQDAGKVVRSALNWRERNINQSMGLGRVTNNEAPGKFAEVAKNDPAKAAKIAERIEINNVISSLPLATCGGLTVVGGAAANLGPHAPAEVPNSYAVVRGGQAEMPPAGTTFSGAAGPNTAEAASGVPHGTIRETTAGAIREGGGNVELVPEATRSGALNTKHVNVVEGTKSTFSEPKPNPVPKVERVQ